MLLQEIPTPTRWIVRQAIGCRTSRTRGRGCPFRPSTFVRKPVREGADFPQFPDTTGGRSTGALGCGVGRGAVGRPGVPAFDVVLRTAGPIEPDYRMDTLAVT